MQKQPVERHGVIDARTGQNQSIGATKGGDHDRRSHELDAHGTKHHRRGGRSHTVFGSVLNGRKGQYVEVNHIGSDIKHRYDGYSEPQGQRNVAPGVANFGARERDVIPGVG